MAAPNAPMPLANQHMAGQNITITVPLQGLGAPPTFMQGGTAFNSGNPTATYTCTGGIRRLLDVVEDLWKTGSASVS